MYADDTAVLCSGSKINTARERAQSAADALVKWADQWKMRIASEKTQALVLSQWARDAENFSIKVAGTSVKGSKYLNLLGINIDRLLHFGEHCRKLRRKVKPRIAQLRKLTGRNWGLQESQLRTIANGYVRGALEYAASAWLPAASGAHVELIDRELRAAARAVTGCPVSTPVHALMAEAGLPTAQSRRKVLAARMVGLAVSLPEQDPLRTVGETDAPSRLKTTVGWRTVGREALAQVGAERVRVEERLTATIPPWIHTGSISFCLDIGPGGRRDSPEQVRKETADRILACLPQQATWVWTDGSAEGGVSLGGGGAIICLSSGETQDVRVAAGSLCSSTRAELCALKAALETVRSIAGHQDEPLVVCTDSQAALRLLEGGAAAQTSPLGAAIWQHLIEISAATDVYLQWVPAHCGLRGNERADTLAKEASGLPQETSSVDMRTLTKAVSRHVTRKWQESWPDGLFKSMMRGRLPPPISELDRESAVNVHQLRAGHWGLSEQYLHRIGRRPDPACQQCPDKTCPAARCIVCNEEADTPEHILLRCPSLEGLRLREAGVIDLKPEQLRDGGLVATLAAGYLRHKGPLRGPQAGPIRP